MRKIMMLIFSLCTLFAEAQVWNGNLYLRSQQEIDDFANFSYTRVTGFVTIDDAGDGTIDIKNLAGLEWVEGLFTIIGCNQLANTAFLNLKTVGGITINSNAALATINNLPLSRLLGEIRILNNPVLSSITGFDSLVNTNFGIVVYNNPLLADITGFSSLESFAGLWLEKTSLSNLNGFSKVKKIRDGLKLIDNPLLSHIDGLLNMTICGQVTISNNASLIHLNGFGSLISVASIMIADNPALQNVIGLSALTGTVTIDIQNNMSLQSVNGSSTLTRLPSILISNNDALKTISGFNNVQHADLEITGNDQLESVTGFNNATTIGDYRVEQNLLLKKIHLFPQVRNISRFSIEANIMVDEISPMPLLDTVFTDFSFSSDTLMSNLDFLGALRFVGGNLLVVGIEKLSDISGLSNLDSVGGNVRITLFNTKDISALSNIEYLNGNFNLGAAYDLQSLAGLGSLKKVKGDFSIGGFSKLTNLNDLVNLDSIGGTLYIFNMLALTNLNGLQNLLNLQYTYIQDNPLLNNFCGLYNTFSQTPPTLAQIVRNLSNPTAEDIRNGGPCSTLPVRWVAFNLKCVDNIIYLNWITDNEINNRHFIVQRSIDGALWVELGQVAGAGINAGETRYAFTDHRPMPGVYYRIAQVDFDGQVHYSSVISANCFEQAGFKLWPNPTAHKVFIRLHANQSSPAFVKIFDGKGGLIKSRHLVLLPGQNQVEMDISGFSAGVYFVEVIWDGHRQRSRASVIHL